MFVTFYNIKPLGILQSNSVRKKSQLLEALSDMAINCQMCKSAGGASEYQRSVHPDTTLL